MPYSYSEYKQYIRNHFLKNIKTDIKILDVGPGDGAYSIYLRDIGYKIVCIEIWEPYIQKFDLVNKYDNVIVGDSRELDISPYDYIIMGDVLEHLNFEDARKFVNKLDGRKCLVAVPYNSEQEEYEGNIYEIHHQPDLSKDNFLERYPEFRLLIGNDLHGYYINYPCWL
jgi:cyclopropane fatty-acyl-phospholipid synthase-like methyltransferase